MNKLLFPNGGVPLYGDDFGFLDTANRDALKGILFEVAKVYNGNFILGGCELAVAGANFTVSSGWLMVDYEVCKFDGGTYPVSGGVTGTFSLSVTSDPGGLKAFANGSSQQTWQVRKAVFSAGVTAGSPLDYEELRRFSDAVESLINQKVTSSTSFTMNNGWSKSISETPILYRHLKQVHWVGDLVPGTILQNSFTKITTLPVGFRPVKRFKSVQSAYQSTLFGIVMLDFFTNGEVYAAATDANAWDLVSLNISFVAV